jgi:hypothetical protein
LGIDFLKKEQQRRNQLIRMDMGSSSNDGIAVNGLAEPTPSDIQAKMMAASRHFQKGAGRFILATAVPYMLQIIAYGNVNYFAYHCVLHDIHRAVRLNELFDHDNNLVAMSNDSATSPGGK